MQLRNKNLVVVDLETSGINPFLHDVLAVGLIPLQPNAPGKVIYVRHSNIEWSEFAEKNFRRFSADWMSSALAPIEACVEIEKFLTESFDGEPATPIGHNIGFDVSFLKRLAFQAGREEIRGLSHRALDTHTMLHLLYLRGSIPLSAVKSDGAFKHFGITISDTDRHTALGDALATRELFFKLLPAFEIREES